MSVLFANELGHVLRHALKRFAVHQDAGDPMPKPSHVTRSNANAIT